MMKRTGLCGLFLVLASCGQTADPRPTGQAQSGATPLPCDVGATLQTKCWDCHGPTLNFTAPMHLMTYEDVHRKTRDGKEDIYQRMKERIHSTAEPMPPPTMAPLTDGEKALLDSWIDQGAPAGTGCQQQTGAGGASGTGSTPGSGGTISYGGSTGSSGGTTGLGGAGGIGGTTSSGDSGVPPGDQPVEPDPSECQYIDIHARDNATATSFTVPTGEDYHMFAYHMTFEAGAQGLAFYPVIDNTAVIHHWLLYKTVTVQTDGATYTALGTHPDGALLAGWAPGGGNWFMPSHVGMDLGQGDFILEVHYNNSGAPAQDHSGVKICKAVTHRPDVATLSWLGDVGFNIPAGAQNYDYRVDCHPHDATQTIHILTTWPHMHKLGRNMHAIIHRNDGTTPDLVNQPFDFNYQRQYSTPVVLNPGEWIENHCQWTNDTGSAVGFGEVTSAEMCFDFVAAYPANALTNGWSIATSTPCNL